MAAHYAGAEASVCRLAAYPSPQHRAYLWPLDKAPVRFQLTVAVLLWIINLDPGWIIGATPGSENT